MDRNTVLAFVLILLTVWFFQSRFYQERIRGIRHDVVEEVHSEAPDSAGHQRDGIGGVRGESVRDTISAARVTGERVSAPEGGDGTGAVRETVWVETDKLVVGIDQRGAVIVSVRTREYGYARGKVRHTAADSGIELVPRGGTGLSVKVRNEELDRALFMLDGADSGRIVLGDRDSVDVVFKGTVRGGREVMKVYRFRRDAYTFDLMIRSAALVGAPVRVGWPGGIEESEWRAGDRSVQYDPRKAHVFGAGEVEHIRLKKPGEEGRTGAYRWAGVSSKYFLVALIAGEECDGEVTVWAFADSLSESNRRAQLYNHAFAMTRVAESPEVRYRVYAGPMKIQRLRKEGVKLEKVLYGGWTWFFRADKWFPWICEVMLYVLIGLHAVVRDYGVAIVLLTVAVKVITYPLSVSSARSMVKMKELQPKVAAIRQRYKSDMRKMNEALMELYRENGVNPFNPGCLPMFLQMPVLFSLYVVLRKAIELRGAGTVLVPWVRDLSQPEVLFRLPFSIPFYGDNFALMPIAMAVVTFFQNKASIKDPNQVAMVYVMPVMMLVLFNSFPSGLVLYWTLSSALGLAQQFAMERWGTGKGGVGEGMWRKLEGGLKRARSRR